MPPSELLWRVSVGSHDPKHFVDSGRRSVADMQAALASIGRRFEDYPRLLDWGCGCGRVLLWLEDLVAGAEVIGTDIDGEAIRWAQEHIPWARLMTNPPTPPLDLPDASIDLVFNHSVLSHLDEAMQDLWLAELRRVTRPGGHVLLSIVGEGPFDESVPGWEAIGWDVGRIRADWADPGFVFIEDDMWVGGPFPDFYHSAFHAPWYVFRHWTKFFNVRAYVVRGALGYMDFVLLERPAE